MPADPWFLPPPFTTPDDPRRSADAALRNRDPILQVLRRVLPSTGTVLELASGSGEHVAHFAAALPALGWVPSDPEPENRASVRAWAGPLANVAEPLDLDVTRRPWPIDSADAVLASNVVHVTPWEATLALLAGAAGVLPEGGLVVLYGPYHVDGRATSPGNAAFDTTLRAHDPRWGVRDQQAVVDAAAAVGLGLGEIVEMPANNRMLVFRRG